MWLPKTESEIVQAVQSGALQESAIFDAKEQLSKNSEIAKDIAAMANDGGVIIYGLGEDEYGRVNYYTPINLDGQAEKVDAIVRSSIAEPPIIHISTIPTQTDPEVGYLVVFVPPSERAPHMVIVKGDHRFYGRTATGNYPLPEGEVARLYTRRQLKEFDREALLRAEMDRWAYPPNPRFGYLYLFARPVFIKDRFLEPLLEGGESYQDMLNSFIDAACKTTVYPQCFYPDFCRPSRWIQHADGFKGSLGLPDNPTSSEAVGNVLNFDVDLDGMVHLFCGSIAMWEQNKFLFFPETLSGLTIRFLNFLGALYEKASYYGMVDLGIAITGIQGCTPYMENFPRFGRIAVPYPKNAYQRTVRIPTELFKDDLIGLTKEIIMPFISAITLNHFDPFQKLASK